MIGHEWDGLQQWDQYEAWVRVGSELQLVAHWVPASLIRPGVRLLSRCRVCEESRSEGACTLKIPPLPDLGGEGNRLRFFFSSFKVQEQNKRKFSVLFCFFVVVVAAVLISICIYLWLQLQHWTQEFYCTLCLSFMNICLRRKAALCSSAQSSARFLFCFVLFRYQYRPRYTGAAAVT